MFEAIDVPLELKFAPIGFGTQRSDHLELLGGLLASGIATNFDEIWGIREPSTDVGTSRAFAEGPSGENVRSLFQSSHGLSPALALDLRSIA